MVSQIGWIVTIGSYEDSISTTVEKPGFVETTCANSGIWEDDASPKVLMALVLVERCLRERRGKGFCSSMITNLF